MSETNKTINTVDMEKVSAILLDVAGTTTAISFVKDTLYPYIIKNAEEFLKNSWENEDVKKAVAQFEEKELDASKAAEAVKNLTEKDDSNVGLKTIQGLLLKKGYEGGDLKGQLFADVQKFLESWSSTKKFAVFSSGSVESQQLLFKNSSEGDLTTHIKKFFDLSVGSKTDSETYTKIAKELEVSPVEVLFLTDDVKEAEAAKSAELNVVIVEREGNAPISEEIQGKFTVVKSFADISVEKMKRKIVEDSTEEPPKKLAKVEINAVTDIKNENEKKIEETKQTDEKKDTENCDEAMDVDEEPVLTEKVEEEKVSAQDEKKSKTEESVQENTVKPKPEATEEIPESMEVDAKVESKTDDIKKDQTDESTEVKQESEEQTNKAEIEMGTQTKCAVTNECETQTTISIAAVDELPIKEVQNKLMASQTEGTKEGEIVEKAEKNDDKKNVDVVEEKCDKEEKETENETNTNSDVKGDKIENKNEVQEESKKDKAENEDKGVRSEEGSEKIEELKEGVKEVKEDVKELGEKVQEVEEEVKEVKEVVKEDIKDAKEDVKVVKEDSKESKDVKEDKVIKEKNDEVKENGKVCEKFEGESESKKDVVDGKNKDKEITDEKKAGLESNGAQENKDSASHENGIADITVEKENKSQLANGKDSDVPNGEASQVTNGTSDKKEEEIKVKKIGDNVESAPVSVEA